MVDLTQNTDPIRNAFWWTRERFYLVPEQPWVQQHWRIGRLRLLRWGPRFFWALSWRRGPTLAATYKFPAFQIYLGWGKCDGSRTIAYQQGVYSNGVPQSGYVLTWTFAEMIAIRTHHLDEYPIWSNMGGC